jgi:catechol-2,3-dioxygenase
MTQTQPSKRHLTVQANHDVAIHVSDLAKAEEFYGKQLGFKVKSRTSEQLSFDAGAFTLWVNKDSQNRSFIPSFTVSDYAEARKALEAAGCKPVSGNATYFEDPFGFTFDIIEQR